MNTRRIRVATLVILLIGTGAFTASGAPGASRLPWSDAQELLRLEVMGPSVQAPSKEYILLATEPIEDPHLVELTGLGIEVISVRGDSAIVRGSLRAFSDLFGDSERLAWVRSALPHLPIDHSVALKFYAIEMEHALSACGVDALQSVDGLLVAVIDGGFTGELEDLLGSNRTHYLEVSDPSDSDGGAAQLVVGRNWDKHGTMCAEAIAAVVPRAEFLLLSAPNFLDRLNIMKLIAEGAEILVDGRSINLSGIDVISDSTFYPVPLDHNDGAGELAQLADEIVSTGIPYVYALGNFGQGVGTDRTYYASVFQDSDGNQLHDFDPQASSANDKDSLSITLDPWEGEEPAVITVILEWDGWPYQVRAGTSAWTTDDVVRIQDIDLFVFYKDPVTSSVIRVTQADRNQLSSLYAPGPPAPIEPLEVVQFEAKEPGTYLLVVRNATPDHPNNLKTRHVDFHMYVRANGTTFTIEHHTEAGALINVGGAKNVLSVGAVGFTTTEAWCLMPYSSHGPTDDGRMKPELVAPNGYVSDLLDDVFGGTSASAPLVAGIVAWLRGRVPQATPEQLREALCQTAQRLTGACNDAPGPVTCVFCEDACNYGVGCGMADAWEAYRYLEDMAQ